jgi:uncharacterized protein with PQ loop repeat
MTRVFGWIAVCLSLTYKVPQIWKLYKTRDTRGISVISQIWQASAYGFYIIHGTLIEDPPIVFLGITSLLQSLILIAQWYAFRHNFERAATAAAPAKATVAVEGDGQRSQISGE